MIKLNLGGDQGIADIPNWEEITSRPRFKSRIDPEKTKISAVIGYYEFSEEVHCGLPCNQPHKSGYLVTTADGYETNVGHICGRVVAGADEFNAMRKSFKTALRRQEASEAIHHCKNHLGAHLQRFHPLFEQAKRTWAPTRALTGADDILPKQVVREIRNMVSSGNHTLKTTVRLTSEEVEQQEAMTRIKSTKPQFKEVQVGRISGLQFLNPENDLRKLLVLGVKITLDRVKNIDIDSATDQELIDLSKSISEIDGNLSAAERAIGLAKKLLSPDNIQQLKQTDGLSQKDRKLLNIFINSLPSLESIPKAA